MTLRHLLIFFYVFIAGGAARAWTDPLPIDLPWMEGAPSLPLFEDPETIHYPVRNANPGVGEILVIGDSLALGRGAKTKEYIPSNCLANAFHMPTQNWGVSGLTSGELLQDLDRVAVAQPKLIFVSSGGNDVLNNLQWPGAYPEAKSLQEMEKIFDTLFSTTNALVIYLGLKPPILFADRLPKISQMARDKGIIVVDGMRGLWGSSKYMTDPVHPNDEGYKIMCERILKVLQGYFP